MLGAHPQIATAHWWRAVIYPHFVAGQRRRDARVAERRVSDRQVDRGDDGDPLPVIVVELAVLDQHVGARVGLACGGMWRVESAVQAWQCEQQLWWRCSARAAVGAAVGRGSASGGLARRICVLKSTQNMRETGPHSHPSRSWRSRCRRRPFR